MGCSVPRIPPPPPLLLLLLLLLPRPRLLYRTERDTALVSYRTGTETGTKKRALFSGMHRVKERHRVYGIHRVN